MSQIEISLRHRLGDFQLAVEFQTAGHGVTALFGPSGCGKTSVLRAVAGLLRVGQGLVRINGDCWQSDTHFVPVHRRALGYVFQEASLFAHLSVERNLLYGWRRVAPAQRRLGFDTVVELLGIGPLLSRDTRVLSGGERQRVAIGRALLTSPRLLLMDEPLSALDQTARRAIFPYLESVHRELSVPSLYVSHDPDEVAHLADHLVLLDAGRVVASGSAADLLTRLDLPLARFEGATAVVQGRVAEYDPHYALSWIELHGGRVAIAGSQLPRAEMARVQIRARDVSLALSAPTDSSILNLLPVRVSGLEDVSDAHRLVRLQLGDGQKLLARITRRSGDTLGLQPGMAVYAQVKSVALMD